MFPEKLPGEDLMNSWYPILFALACGVIFTIRSYFRGAQCSSRELLKEKTVIITGANTGIGFETAKDFAQRGARVIIACRDAAKGKEAENLIKVASKSKSVTFMKLDLTSLESIRNFAQIINTKEKKVDILVNNAGVMCHPRETTADGFEIHFQVNYLGHFLLTNLLLPKLKESSPSKVINVTANAYQLAVLDLDDLQYEQREYRAGDAYATSKLAVLIMTRHMAKLYEDSGVVFNAVNPGVVRTSIHRHMPFQQNSLIRVTFAPFLWFLMKSAKDGSQGIINCAVSPEEQGVSGKLYVECKVKEPDPMATDESLAARLYDASMRLCGLSKMEEVEPSLDD